MTCIKSSRFATLITKLTEIIPLSSLKHYYKNVLRSGTLITTVTNKITYCF